MTDIDLDHIEDIVRAKAAIERDTKQGDIETVTQLVRAERLAAATFKEIKTTVKECVNRYNSTATRELVSPLKISADNLREFAVGTSDEKGSFAISLEGAAIKYSRATTNRPLEEWILRANDTPRVRAKLMEFLWEA
jgi:hypothetical protein